MAKNNINTQKTIEILNHHIIDLDSFRLPISFINPHFFTFFKFYSNFSKLGKKSDLFQKNPDLHGKVHRELDPYFKEVVKITLIDLALYFGGYFLIKILLIIIQMILQYTFLIENTALDFTMFIIEFFWLISLLFWIFTTHMRVAGKKYDEQIKNATQELIDCKVELIKEKNLDPNKNYLNLKHNDYHNPKY